MQKVIYFSDGAVSQYKNYKAFISLCFHERDHSLKAEWHFFATSHGKSPFDGVGGTVKPLVANASLKARHDECILTPMQLHEWATKNIKGVYFFYISSENVNATCVKFDLDKRYSFGSTTDGTRSHHNFIPVSMNSIEMRRISFDDIFSRVTFGHIDTDTSVTARQIYSMPV